MERRRPLRIEIRASRGAFELTVIGTCERWADLGLVTEQLVAQLARYGWADDQEEGASHCDCCQHGVE